MVPIVTIPHIHMDAQGRPWLDDTNIKVVEIVLDHQAHGWSAETIQEHYPHLTLAQVYAALAWYYDHQAELDLEIEKQGDRLKTLRASSAPSALQQRALPGKS